MPRPILPCRRPVLIGLAVLLFWLSAFISPALASSILEVGATGGLPGFDEGELPRYLACFDVATIPFKVTPALQAVSPIKLFEYMAGGRPIVTTDLVECRKYPVVRIACSPQEWVERLREAVALRQDDDYLAQVRYTAEQNTWAARAHSELQALEARTDMGPRRGQPRQTGQLGQLGKGASLEPTGSARAQGAVSSSS